MEYHEDIFGRPASFNKWVSKSFKICGPSPTFVCIIYFKRPGFCFDILCNFKSCKRELIRFIVERFKIFKKNTKVNASSSMGEPLTYSTVLSSDGNMEFINETTCDTS